MKKPLECATCPFCKFSTGFVADFCPPAPLIAIVAKMPGRDEIVAGSPMVGKMGRYAFKEFIESAGFTRPDVMICNVLRCFPNGGEFPVGTQRKVAVEGCRQWDAPLRAFDPNLFIVSFNPAALMRNPQQTRFLQQAFEKAFRFVQEGYRPCLLLGEEAKETFAPWLIGSMKRWQGHCFEGNL